MKPNARSHAVALILSAALSGAGLAYADPLVWSFAYDDAGRTTLIRTPSGARTRFDYTTDSASRVHHLVKTLPDGQAVRFELDDRGRLTRLVDGLGEARWEYDRAGRLRAYQRGAESVRTDYDDRGRLAAIETPAGTIRYQYDTAQGRTLRTLPNGWQILYEHSARGRLLRLLHLDPERRIRLGFEYRYRPDGLIAVVQTDAESTHYSTQYDYDRLQRLVAVHDSRGADYQYRYDPLGNRIEARGPQGTATAAYDRLGTLKQIGEAATPSPRLSVSPPRAKGCSTGMTAWAAWWSVAPGRP